MQAQVIPVGDPVDEDADATDAEAPVPLSSLFRFASWGDLALMFTGLALEVVVGCGMAAMNVVFGEVIDDLSTASGTVQEALKDTVIIMVWLAAIMGVTAFVAMSSVPYAAARISNNLRMEYLKAVLRQDMVRMSTRVINMCSARKQPPFFCFFFYLASCQS